MKMIVGFVFSSLTTDTKEKANACSPCTPCFLFLLISNNVALFTELSISPLIFNGITFDYFFLLL